MKNIKSEIFSMVALVCLFIFSCEKMEDEEKPDPDPPTLPVVITNPEVKDGVLSVLEFKPAAKSDRHMMQMAVDYAEKTDAVHTVFVPDGTYLIDAAGEEESGNGVRIRSNMHFKMAENAVLKAIPNDARNYSILRISTATDVKVSGGRIVGERDEHFGTNGGEWGHGIEIRQGRRVVIEHVHISKCWGDGIYIGGSYNTDITVDNVISDNNRRQGMSVTQVDSLVVKNSTFSNTKGTAPEAGLDLEPNEGNSVTNVYIVDCVFENNASAGLALYAMDHLSKIFAESCMMINNKTGINVGQPAKHIEQPKTAEISFKDIEIIGKTETGLEFRRGVKDVKFSNVNVTGYVNSGVYSYLNSHDIEFLDCTFKTDETEATGLVLNNTREISFVNCAIQGGKQGALLEDASKITLRKTAFSGLSNNAIRFNRSNDNVIDDVTVESVSRDNIELVNSRNNQIVNSTFKGGDFLENGQFCFMVFKTQSSDNTISNNIIKHGSGSKKARYGIHFMSSTTSNTASGNQVDPGAFTEKSVIDDGNNQIE